ncbi:MAG TPA: hypothetical protein VFW94_21100 [Candidatus Acidoferrales bacterium]|nr:hypothetical protein [Candidatus Acidoferrales bacterium]
MTFDNASYDPYPRAMIRAVRDWRAKQTPQERIRWDQIWDYFRAERRLAPGTVLPNGKIIVDSQVVYRERQRKSERSTPPVAQGHDPDVQ